jgi:hypothetical protein
MESLQRRPQRPGGSLHAGSANRQRSLASRSKLISISAPGSMRSSWPRTAKQLSLTYCSFMALWSMWDRTVQLDRVSRPLRHTDRRAASRHVPNRALSFLPCIQGVYRISGLFVVSSGTVPHPACPAAIAQRGIAGTSGLVGR